MPTTAFQMQGVLVQQDLDNWLRFEIQHDGDDLRLFVAANLNGASSLVSTEIVAIGDIDALRIQRIDDMWRVAYGSTTDDDWSESITFVQPFTVSALGLYAANHAVSPQVAPAYTARFKQIRLQSSAEPAAQVSGASVDAIPPLIQSVAVDSDGENIHVSWFTDEVATGRIA